MDKHKKKIWSYIVWGCIILCIGGLFAAGIIALFNYTHYKTQKIDPNHITTDEELPLDVFATPTTPTGSYYADVTQKPPLVSAASFIVADLQTGQIILDKSGNEQRPIASITKLMTALVAREELPLQDTTKISSLAIATESGRGALSVGQEFPIDELIYPLLLTSSNDAAEAIAEARGRSFFISRMNDKAREIGMQDSTFGDASGLSPLNRSTAYDLFLLIRHIYTYHPQLLKITRSPYYIGEKQTWQNISNLLAEKTYYGGKTGYTNPARQTSVGIYNIMLKNQAKRTLVITILKSDERENDIRKIILYLENYIEYK
jgi:D-alanyl-D-alanine carboxypeptidase